MFDTARKRFVLMIAVVCVATLSAQQATLSEADLKAAIDLGNASRARLHPDWSDLSPDLPYFLCKSTYWVMVTGPVSRVAIAAFDAKKKYLPFTVASTDASMMANVLHISAYINIPQNMEELLHANVKHVTIVGGSGRNPAGLVPISTEPLPFVALNNRSGGNMERNGLAATFKMEDFRQLPSPLSVRMLGADGYEHKCSISDKARAAIR